MFSAQFSECYSRDPIIRALGFEAVIMMNDLTVSLQYKKDKIRAIQKRLRQHLCAAAQAKNPF